MKGETLAESGCAKGAWGSRVGGTDGEPPMRGVMGAAVAGTAEAGAATGGAAPTIPAGAGARIALRAAGCGAPEAAEVDEEEETTDEAEDGGGAAGASIGFGREDGRRRAAFALRDDAGPATVAVPDTKVAPDDDGARVSTEEEEAAACPPPPAGDAPGIEVDGRAAFGAAPPITRVFMLVSFLRGSGAVVVRRGSLLAPVAFAEVAFPGDAAILAPRLGSVASPSRGAVPASFRTGVVRDALLTGEVACGGEFDGDCDPPSDIGGAAGRW